MGVESSSLNIDNGRGYAILNVPLVIPTVLRPVYPFLYDAYRFVKSSRKDVRTAASKKRVGLGCIHHAFKLLLVLNLELDNEARECLMKFNEMRNQLGKELGIALEPIPDQLPGISMNKTIDPNTNTTSNHDPEAAGPSNSSSVQSHEILLAEADSILALAEEQLQENMRFEASLNYHSAAVFYRVLMSMIPSLASVVHQRLHYSAFKTRQTSSIHHNFVLEHFGSKSCADVYEVHGTAKLGKGSYGSVYLATHRATGDERAVKVMNVDRVTSYYLRKLHTEIAVLRAIDHPNIVKLQDVFFGRRSVYLVTDLCRGGELFELLNSGKAQGFVFREDRASQLMRDMVSAVFYLHERGIVHRDLKLENFLFESKTATSPLVLIDFGLSRFYEPDDFMNQRVGSCYYTAPEVLNGSYDQRCDNWSLGVLCYMLLSGTPPFYGKTVDEVYHATLTQEPVFVEKKFRHVSTTCIDFMQRLLTKDLDRRMTSGEALQHPFITGLAPSFEQLSYTSTISSSSSSSLPMNVLSSSASPINLPLAYSNSSGVTSTGIVTPPFGSVDNTNSSSGLFPPSPGFNFPWNPFSSSQSNSNPGQISHNSTPISSKTHEGMSSTQQQHIVSLSRRNTLPVEISTSVVESLVIYASADPLIRLAIAMVSHTLSPDITIEMRRVFQVIDSSHSGIIYPRDLTSAVISCQAVASGAVEIDPLVFTARLKVFAENGMSSNSTPQQTPTHHRTLSGRLDFGLTSSSGRHKSSSTSTTASASATSTTSTAAVASTVATLGSTFNLSQQSSSLSMDPSQIHLTYHDFLAAILFSRMNITDERMKYVFNTLDPENSGYLSADSFRKFYGTELSDHAIVAMIQSADWDGDGLVSENDFMQKWRHFRRSHGRNHSDVNASMAHTAQNSMISPPHPSYPSSNAISAAPLPAAAPFHRRSASGGKPFTLRSQNQSSDGSTAVSISGSASSTTTPPHHRRQRSHQTISTIGIAGLGQEPMDLT